MAGPMTFNSLCTDIAAYMERGQSAEKDPQVFERLPLFVNLAERQLAAELKLQGFQEPVLTTLAPGDTIVPKPARWRQTVSINFGGGPTQAPVRFLLARSYEFIRSACPVPAVTGVPRWYADYDFNHWLIGPAPALDYDVEVQMFAIPQMLSTSVQTNWTTEIVPQALLYGALVKLAEFVNAPERVQQWQAAYGAALAAITQEDMQKVQDRTSVRRGP